MVKKLKFLRRARKQLSFKSSRTSQDWFREVREILDEKYGFYDMSIQPLRLNEAQNNNKIKVIDYNLRTKK